MTTETNKNRGTKDSKEKKFNISNLDEGDCSSKKIKRKNNKIIDDLNEMINQNYFEENNNNIKRCNTYKSFKSDNYNEEENENELDNNLNSNNVNNNFFSNSLFNEFTSNTTELKDSNFDIININLNNNRNTSPKNDNLNNLISKNASPYITNNDFNPVFVNKNGEWHIVMIDTTPEELLKIWSPVFISGVLLWLTNLAKNKYQEKIARLTLSIINRSMLEEIMLPHVLKDIDNIEKAILIENFENFNQQRYQNVALKFKNPLKEILLKNNIGRIFLNAKSFNNTNHSPAALYIRMGFTPLFRSKESIMQELFSTKRIKEDDGIWFEYMPQKN